MKTRIYTIVVYTWDHDASNADECVTVHQVRAGSAGEVKAKHFPAENEEVVAVFRGKHEPVRKVGCEECREEFHAESYQSKFCSARCRNRSNARKHRGRAKQCRSSTRR